MKEILLSGIKPTGKLHIGNYFGAMKQFVEHQHDFDAYIFVANYHALNAVSNREVLRRDTLDVVIDYLAVGLNPEKVTLYVQSDVPEVTELTVVFDTLITMPYLSRAHAFKDAEAKKKEINVGTFNYPVLMAADILMMDAKIVPVGQDQKQHVEYARDIAEKFNFTFGETFILPKEKILEHVAVVPGLDGQKMSKSYGNTIPLFAEKEEIKKLVMTIPTDSKSVENKKNPEEDKVFALHKLFATKEELAQIEKRYKEGGLGYKESKELLAESIDRFIAPLRAKRNEIAADEDKVIAILKKGGEKARARAQAKMKIVRDKVGIF